MTQILQVKDGIKTRDVVCYEKFSTLRFELEMSALSVIVLHSFFSIHHLNFDEFDWIANREITPRISHQSFVTAHQIHVSDHRARRQHQQR